MKLTIRSNVFETNSSSMHAFVYLTEDDLQRWKNGEFLDLQVDDWFPGEDVFPDDAINAQFADSYEYARRAAEVEEMYKSEGWGLWPHDIPFLTKLIPYDVYENDYDYIDDGCTDPLNSIELEDNGDGTYLLSLSYF